MEITINVADVDINSLIPDLDGNGGETPLADLVVAELVDRAVKTREYNQRIGERVQAIRDEEIRAQIAPVIAAELAKPLRLTNSYGEPTGKETTLREMCVEAALKVVKEPADRHSSNRASLLEVEVQKQVRAALVGEIAQAVAEIKASLVKTLTGDVSSMIAKAAAEAVKK